MEGKNQLLEEEGVTSFTESPVDSPTSDPRTVTYTAGSRMQVHMWLLVRKGLTQAGLIPHLARITLHGLFNHNPLSNATAEKHKKHDFLQRVGC